ncbi:MAG: hypothetical protein R2796_05455 [Chitinophagaceae bacterium]
MGKEKNNYYVVWIWCDFKSWNDCRKQIGTQMQNIKVSKDLKMQKMLLNKGPDEYWGKKYFESSLSIEQLKIIGSPNTVFVLTSSQYIYFRNGISKK